MPTTADPFDELAALFLTDPDRPAGVRGARRAATVELLIVGHLPVRGSLWLVPYADAVAREAGPTALVRLDDDRPSLEILRGPSDSPRPEAGGTLREAIAQIAGVPASWMVRPAGGITSGEIIEAGADRITILTSADQAAVVRAYEWIRNLMEAAGRSLRDAPRIGLAVLGADPEVARGVMERVNQTAKSNLDIELPLVACVPWMDAEVRSSGPLRFTREPTPDVADVITWIKPPTSAPATATASPQAGVVRDDPVEPAHAREEAAEADHVQFGVPASAPASPAPTAVCQACGSTVKLVPKPSVELETKTPAGPIEPDHTGAPIPLADHVDGLTPLAVRCPGHERVELAVDIGGRLNILGREDAMRQMRIVETWAKAHRELISMACPDQWIDPGGETITHVFTERPASVADLHGSDLRLHVLTPVTVEGRKGWYAAPLNAVVR